MDDEANTNLVELIELLQEITEKADANTDTDPNVIYDKDGTKIIL